MQPSKALEEEFKKEVDSADDRNDESNANDKDAYFIILIHSEKIVDFRNLKYETKNKITPLICYYQKNIFKENNTFLQEIVFKFKKKRKKKKKIKTKKNQLNRLNTP